MKHGTVAFQALQVLYLGCLSAWYRQYTLYFYDRILRRLFASNVQRHITNQHISRVQPGGMLMQSDSARLSRLVWSMLTWCIDFSLRLVGSPRKPTKQNHPGTDGRSEK
jgi:hypothetical protein